MSLIPGEAIDKAAAEVIEKTIGAAGAGVVSSAGDLLGGLVGDRVRDWRNRKMIERAAETAAIMRQKGIDLSKARELPMGQWYALFDGATVEDDDDVGTLWSALLANSLDPKSDIQADKLLIQALKALSGEEARILNFMVWCTRKRLELNARLDAKRAAATPPDAGLPQAEIIAEEMRRLSEEGAPLVRVVYERYQQLETDLGDGFRYAVGRLMRFGLIDYVDDAQKVADRARSELMNLRREGSGEQVGKALVTLSHAVSPKAPEARPRILSDRFAQVWSPAFDVGWMHYKLTPFGRRLMEACDADSDEQI